MDDNEIFALPLSDAWLLYAPLHDLSALINDAALEALRDTEKRKSDSSIEKIRAIISRAPESTPSPREGEFQPAFLGLIPTRECNLDCAYCGFRAGSDATGEMPRELINQSIKWFVGTLKDQGREVLHLHFFGGEPLYKPELVKYAVQVAKEEAAGKGLQARFEVSTNGVMNEETARFVADNIDVVVFSLDGPADIHDRHRPAHDGSSSFDIIYRNARLFSAGKCGLHLRACITSETVMRMVEIAEWFCAEFRPQTVCFETLQPSPESATAGLKPPDPWEFASKYIDAAGVLEGKGIETVYATSDISKLRVSFCPVGSDAVIVSPDGKAAGCYLLERDWQARGLDLSLGRFAETGEFVLDEDSVSRLRSLNVLYYPRCRNCFCRRHCAGACHVNHSYPGCSEEYEDLCIQTRIITLFKILAGLGQRDKFERLRQDQNSLSRVIHQESDRFTDRDPSTS